MRLALLSLLLAGCASTAYVPPPKVITQEIKIAVPTMPVPPAALQECGKRLRAITFYQPPDERFVAMLDAEGVRTMQENDAELAACIRAWRIWAKPM